MRGTVSLERIGENEQSFLETKARRQERDARPDSAYWLSIGEDQKVPRVNRGITKKIIPLNWDKKYSEGLLRWKHYSEARGRGSDVKCSTAG